MVIGTVVVTLDGLVIDPRAASVCADDPMLLRGDGVFETVLVRDGRPCLLGAHLARLATSAAITGLPAPEPARWRHAVAAAVGNWAHPGDAVLRLLLGRARTLAFVTVSAVPERAVTARRDGIAAVTLERGPSASAPWSLAGVKSLSYAANAAALRHAQRIGADDVVFVAADGTVLEGPRSAVLIATEDGELLTPPASLPILPGTTVGALFVEARGRGLACQEQQFGVADLVAAQGVWLLSSVTLAARVHTLDGAPLRQAPRAAEVTDLVDAAILRAD
ncbi:aminodeoxychorismate lyase [Mycobacterium sp. URHB0044]|uniref:aminodeoxychorismate lyase n=1 Tax=Mycobacterium sp. URHB0044 TaxID=1380386 RepID=UPI000561CBC5|nr:aminodeoxychorismate lyase [Mycobacterium sp. URHB0044]